MTSLRLFLTKHGPLLLALVWAAGIIVVSEYANWRASRAVAQTQLSLEIRRTLTTVWRQVLEAETGHRGYLITGKDDYAAPYYGAISAVNQTLQKLHGLYESGGRKTTEFDALSLLVRRKMAELATTYQLRASGSEAEWRKAIETDIGRDLMVLVDKSILGMLDAEQRQLTVAQGLIGEALLLGRIGIALVTMLALLAFALYLRQSMRLDDIRRQQEASLQLERDQLEATANLRARQLGRLASYLVTAREDERARIARELHDELGALFTTAKLDVARLRLRLGTTAPEVVERLQHLTETLNTGVALKRQIIEDLRPSSLSNLGLVAALENLARDFSPRLGAKITTAFEPVRLSPASELTVYRLVQEAFTNIGKHAEAKNVSAELHCEEGMVIVRVRDDGKGFDPGAVPPTSHGLFGMRFRIEEAGGRFAIDSRAGDGTCIEAALPELRE
jgi:signal transduction histidine kinase